MSIHENESGCKAGEKCLFPHHKVDEQPNKKPKKGCYSPKRRESGDKNAVAILKIVPQLGCFSQDSDALVSQRADIPGGNPMQKVLGTVRRVRFTQSTLRQASIQEKKRPSLGKLQVTNPHQRSPHAMKFEDRSNEETERQQRCARSKAPNLAKKISSSKKRTRPHSTFPRRNGYSWLRQQKSRRKDSLQWIQELVCTRSARKTLTLPNFWRP